MGNDIQNLNCCRGENENFQIKNDKEKENGTNKVVVTDNDKVATSKATHKYIIGDDQKPSSLIETQKENNKTKESNKKITELPERKQEKKMSQKGEFKEEETKNQQIENLTRVKKDEKESSETSLYNSITNDGEIKNLTNKFDVKDVKKEVDRERIIKQFANERHDIVENNIPPFTKEYAISNGKLDQFDLNIMYPPNEIIYENGCLVPNASFYFGEKTKRYLRHGFGTLYLSDGSKFTGFWVKNDFSYYGRYLDSEGNVFEGFFQKGSIIGKGTEITAVSTYNGEFSNGVKEGKGCLKTDSEVYEGDFYNNNKNGKGLIQFIKTGNYYEGEFLDGKIEGKGLFKWANGDIYEGDFSNGILHGHGTYKWSNGDSYDGDYVDGMRCGKGRLKNSNGKIYEGEFDNNLPHGKGIIIKEDKITEVEFIKGVPSSQKRKSSTIASFKIEH